VLTQRTWMKEVKEGERERDQPEVLCEEAVWRSRKVRGKLDVCVQPVTIPLAAPVYGITDGSITYTWTRGEGLGKTYDRVVGRCWLIDDCRACRRS
jgi:hypothetical protein